MLIRSVVYCCLLVLLPVVSAQAVVVVGGDGGWEVSFDGNINGFYVYSDRDPQPEVSRTLTVRPMTGAVVPADTMGAVTVTQVGDRAGGAIGGNGTSSSRVRTGLLPAFFSFNVRSPEVNGLAGSARISFAPQIQNANTKNQLNDVSGGQLGAGVDLREAFFNVESAKYGTISVGRTLSLFQRHNILTDMTLFGTGVDGSAAAGGTTLGRIGFGYVYPQFNARISYRTPVILGGMQLEVGAYDPSRICNASVDTDPDAEGVQPFCLTETEAPRVEAEATYDITLSDAASLKFFLSGMYQEAEGRIRLDQNTTADLEVEAGGVAGGAVFDFSRFQFVASGYTGQALGTVLMLDSDALDTTGRERDNDGYILQATYTHGGVTRMGVSYGVSMADETVSDTGLRHSRCGTPGSDMGMLVPYMDGDNCTDTSRQVQIKENKSITVGIYHDTTSWLKFIAEYTKGTVEWYDGREQDADVYSFGAFFTW